MADSSYPIFPKQPTSLEILGLPLHDVDVEEVHDFVRRVIESNQKALVLNLNINCVNLASEHVWMAEFVREAQLTFCDGDGVRWGLRLLGEKAPPKITYDRWVWQLAEFAQANDFTFYFLGAKAGITEEASSRLREKFPRLRVLGTHHGYFEKTGSENEEIVSEINRLKPDILIMGFGMPLQERWLCDHWKRLDCHIFLTGGAVFDYVTGRVPRAPEWMIRGQMEWLFRLMQEPRRLFGRYVFGNPYFFYRVLTHQLRSKKKGRVI